MKTTLSKLALAIAATVWAGSAMATPTTATDTSTLTVSATVQNACAIGSGSAGTGILALDVNKHSGTANPLLHPFDSGTSISVICTLGAAATITGDLGANAAANTRRMVSGGNHLAYELYTESNRSTVLSSTVGISYTGTGLAETSKTIYGQITGAQLAAAPAGSYTDTVGLTITYTP